MIVNKMIPGRKGYSIPVLYNISGKEPAVVLISHGFGSTKESPTVKLMAKLLEKQGMGFLALDFPAHGESPVSGEGFTLDNCLSDLSSAEEKIRTEAPQAKIFYFSSSFGGYINLLYLTLCPHRGEKSFLRCPAVNMPAILKENMTPKIRQDFAKDGFTLLEEDFVRPLQLTKTFYDQLQAHDVFRLYAPGDCQTMMVHGTEDESVSPQKVKEFGEKFHIPLLWIQGADHTFSGEGMMEELAEAALTFFSQ
ncbi:MAG: alpha/beta hydrolase [Anaerovoracaceae bacterium]|jgi:alpha-beta hydrolase superfamily lysophospholipase